MPTIKQRLAGYLLPDDQKRLIQAANNFSEATKLMPRMLTPEIILESFSEIDPRYRDLLLRQLQAGEITYGEPTEEERIQTVYTSQSLYSSDVLVQAVYNIWTDFGFGLHVDIIPRNDTAKESWKEFWDMPENGYVLNQRSIQDLSTKVLKDGDFLFVYYTSEIDGKTTLRVVPSLEIKAGPNKNGVITLPDDSSVPVLYRREAKINGETKTQYYRDWRITDEQFSQIALPEDGELMSKPGTQVRAMLVAHRMQGGFRGWPLMTAGFDWAIAYRNILQDRATIVRANAMFMDKLVTKSGQKAIDNIASRLQSTLVNPGSGVETNPRPAAGSLWLENESATRERLNMGNTGASDAELDANSVLSQAGLGGSVYPHYLGKGEAFRLATATSMERPLLRAFNRYQLFWSSVWSDLAKYVLQSYEQFGGKSFDEEYDVDVSTDSVIDVSFDDLSKATTSLCDMTDRGFIPNIQAEEISEQIMRVYLQTIGVDEVDAIFELEEPEPEEPEFPETGVIPSVGVPVPPGEELPIVPVPAGGAPAEYDQTSALRLFARAVQKFNGK